MKLLPQAAADSHALKCELACEVLRSSGRLRLQVTGWSMLPTVWPGDTLVVDRASSDAVAKGDIVLFARDRRLCAHRVAKKIPQDSTLLTRGDAMPQADPPLSHRDLLGKVSFILRNGECIEPRRELSLAQRAIAGLVRHSDLAARVVVGVHGLRRTLPGQASLHHTSLSHTSNDRAVLCQS